MQSIRTTTASTSDWFASGCAIFEVAYYCGEYSYDCIWIDSWGWLEWWVGVWREGGYYTSQSTIQHTTEWKCQMMIGVAIDCAVIKAFTKHQCWWEGIAKFSGGSKDNVIERVGRLDRLFQMIVLFVKKVSVISFFSTSISKIVT